MCDLSPEEQAEYLLWVEFAEGRARVPAISRREELLDSPIPFEVATET